MNSPYRNETTNNLFFDHAVLVVDDLEKSTDQFRGIGFTVTPGGVHAGQLTHNSLIAFEDGSYLELLAPYRRHSLRTLRLLNRFQLVGRHPSARTPLGRRFAMSLLMGEGINDFALGCISLEEVVWPARHRNLTLHGPTPGGRTRPDGLQVSWRTACPTTRDLPFLIDDTTARSLRVPGGQAANHANQASGVIAISIAVSDLAASTARYQALLGFPPLSNPVAGVQQPRAQANQFQTQFTILALQQTIELAAQAGEDTSKPTRVWLSFQDGTAGSLALKNLAGQGFTLKRITN